MHERILIVGGGIAGLATAWSLARRGAKGVVLLEREQALGQHSTAKNAAILRSSLGNPLEDLLAAEGARFLFAPPAGFAAGPLVDPTGICLVASGPAAEAFDGWLERARELGLPLEEIDAAQVGALAPHVATPIARALHSPSEGRIDIAALTAGYARGAREGGVLIRTGAPVARLLARAGRVAGVELEGGAEIEADVVALAAGGWAGRLGAQVGSRVALRPTRRHMLVTAADARVDPRWPIVWSLDRGFYVRPAEGGLMLCACDEVDVDPDDDALEPAEIEAIRAKAREHVPAFAALPVARAWTGLRTFSADRKFAIGRDPDVPGLAWIAGLGGHGMVSSAAVGRLAAERLLGEPMDELGRALDPARFAEGRPARA